MASVPGDVSWPMPSHPGPAASSVWPSRRAPSAVQSSLTRAAGSASSTRGRTSPSPTSRPTPPGAKACTAPASLEPTPPAPPSTSSSARTRRVLTRPRCTMSAVTWFASTRACTMRARARSSDSSGTWRVSQCSAAKTRGLSPAPGTPMASAAATASGHHCSKSWAAAQVAWERVVPSRGAAAPRQASCSWGERVAEKRRRKARITSFAASASSLDACSATVSASITGWSSPAVTS
mmetsp:Transcript_3834/g.10785  ORF Transcript_3834/g.10785 Transcript_3834/m.10785 type:complete len:236 (+) Transcript_3834:1250-1957(+)